MNEFPQSNGFIEIDHTADIAIAVSGDSVNSLFLESLAALKEISGIKMINQYQDTFRMSLKSESLESLLVAFLNDMLILKETGYWPEPKELIMEGNKLDFICSLFNCEWSGAEIKAVTYNMMEITSREGRFSTKIVFDV